MTDITKVKDIIEAFGLINDLATRLDSLEKWKEEFRSIDEISEQYKQRQEAMEEQIAKLEKKVKDLEDMQETIVESDPVRMQGQIAELQKTFKMIDLCLKVDGKEIKSMVETDTSNQDKIIELGKWLNVEIKDNNQAFNGVDKEINELKEVLREFISWHKEGLHSYDALPLNELLEKLDSGGEKESLNERDSVVSDSKYLSHEGDSKLPEPMERKDCLFWTPIHKCNHYNERLNTANLNCRVCGIYKPTEPEKDKHNVAYLRKIKEKGKRYSVEKYNSILNNDGNRGLLEWCIACLQKNDDILISEFLKDLNYWVNANREGTSTLYILQDIISKWYGRIK